MVIFNTEVFYWAGQIVCAVNIVFSIALLIKSGCV